MKFLILSVLAAVAFAAPQGYQFSAPSQQLSIGQPQRAEAAPGFGPVGAQQPSFAAPAPAFAPQQPSFGAPQPVPFAAPQQPAFAAPQQPSFGAPQPAPFAAPQQPAFAAPQQPAFGAPQPAPFAAPQQPAFGAPQPTQFAAPQPPALPFHQQPSEFAAEVQFGVEHSGEAAVAVAPSAPCAEGQVHNAAGQCVAPDISRNVFVYAAPKRGAKSGTAGEEASVPKVNYNVIFIHTDDEQEGAAGGRPRGAGHEQRTIIYVLNKEAGAGAAGEAIEIPSGPLTAPEVYFVSYADGENPALPDGILLQDALSAAVPVESAAVETQALEGLSQFAADAAQFGGPFPAAPAPVPQQQPSFAAHGQEAAAPAQFAAEAARAPGSQLSSQYQPPSPPPSTYGQPL